MIFEAEKARLEATLGDVAMRIAHVGSTSVPGLAAKPIMDIDVYVMSIEPMKPHREPLEGLGYVFDPGFPDSYFFGYPEERPRRFQVHVAEAGSRHEIRHLAVRDFLRSHPDVAADYAERKSTLTAAHPGNHDAYVDGKAAFMAEWEARALARRSVSCLTVYTPGMAHGPIVLVGGYMSWPVGYRGLARSLADISGSQVHVVRITPLDWALGRIRGYGQLVFEVATAVDKALLESDSDKAVIVGHSAGGILARVYIGGDPPYGGRRYAGHRRVSHLITLGAPHNVPNKGHLAPIAEVNDLFPGALHEPAGLRYLCVAGAAVDGASSRKARKRYERFVEDGRVKGDGEVPVEAALLPGAESLVLDDLHHGRFYGLRRALWYASDRKTVERWWPEELRTKSRLVKEPHA